MAIFSLENVDLFYYHSTDIDVTRIYSILKNGILSAKEAAKLPYYHRNYINSSSKENYISVSHFPRMIPNTLHFDNELYNSSTNKIVFVLDGEINALDKQYYKNRYKYTNERHVENKIEKESIKGIAIRDIYADKKIIEIPFILDHTDKMGQLKKCFDTIKFLEEIHNYKAPNCLYELVGKYIEAQIMLDDEKIINNQICQMMKGYIYNAYKYILKISEPTLLDVIKLYNDNIPIYLMTKYDIKPLEERTDLLTENIALKNKQHQKQIKHYFSQAEQIYSQMCASDQMIIYGLSQGPLTANSYKQQKQLIKLKDEIIKNRK